ncbi:MAG TPA: zinc-binding dehydrogenase [bacterium]|nr:zinc-binding dehydrogenase [bacterium]
MQAIRIHAHGGPEVLKIDDIDVPELRPDHALVRVKAAAMNHMDLWVRKGMPGVKIPLPIILGCEAAGVVEDPGDLRNFKKGAEVVIAPSTSCNICEACLSGNDHYCREYKIYGEHRDGTECETMLVPACNLLLKPKRLSFEEAAAIPLAFLTAWQMLVDRAQVRSGQTVLILAAASGVSSAGVQIAKLFGARVIATASDETKFPKIQELGADHVINHRKQDIAEEVKKLTDKRGVDIVFEHVGAAVWEKCLRSLAFGGRLVTCGATTGYDVKVDLRHIFIKQQQILGSTMGPKASLFKILRLVSEGRLSPVLDRVFPFSQAPEAHHYLEQGSQMGKVVLVP